MTRRPSGPERRNRDRGPPLSEPHMAGDMTHGNRRIAHRKSRNAPDLRQDLEQEGSEAIIKARRRWTPERAIRMSEVSYALTAAAWAMIDYLRALGPYRRRSQAHPEQAPVYQTSLDDLQEKAGSISEESVIDRGYVAVDNHETSERIMGAVAADYPREAWVADQSFLHDRTLRSIGDELGITESAVSQIRTRFLRHARDAAHGRPMRRPRPNRKSRR